MNNWSPIIMARTKNADFKWHVRPSDFKEEHMRWVKKFIIPIMPGTGDSMPVTPVISAFSNGIHTCVGIVCLAKDLASDIQFTVDKFSRMCFAFVGLVTNEPLRELPSVFLRSEKETVAYDLSIYKELYTEYVEAVWEKDPYELELSWLRRNGYSYSFKDQVPVLNGTEYFDLTEKYNTVENYLQVFMVSDAQSRINDYQLLKVFIEDKTVNKSICLNALDRDSIIASPYKNAAINTAIKYERIVRLPPKPIVPPPVDCSIEQTDIKRSERWEGSSKKERKEYKEYRNSLGQQYDNKGRMIEPVDSRCTEEKINKKQKNGRCINSLFGRNQKLVNTPEDRNNNSKPKDTKSVIGLPRGKK